MAPIITVLRLMGSSPPFRGWNSLPARAGRQRRVLAQSLIRVGADFERFRSSVAPVSDLYRARPVTSVGNSGKSALECGFRPLRSGSQAGAGRPFDRPRGPWHSVTPFGEG